MQLAWLTALPQANAKEPAAADSQQALDGVETNPLRIGPRIQEGVDARHLVVAVGDRVDETSKPDGNDRPELQDAAAGDEEDGEGHQRQHDHRAEVGLEQD